MARASVILKIPVIALTRTAIQGESGSYRIIGNTHFYWYNSATKDSEADEKGFITTKNAFTLPQIIVPKTLELTALRLPVQTGWSNSDNDPMGDTGCTFYIQANNTEYIPEPGLTNERKITDSAFLEYINKYISKNACLPKLDIVVDAWIMRPGGSSTSYASAFISPPILEGTINGGCTHIFRPISDISVEHNIPNGYGVYNLINETEADDESTYINSYCVGFNVDDTKYTVTHESKVNIGTVSSEKPGFLIPKNSELVQLRPIIRAKLETDKRGEASTTITISVNDTTETFKVVNGNSYFQKQPGLYFDYNNFNTFECAFDQDSSIVTAINSYYKKHNCAPDINVAIGTSATGSQKDSDYLAKDGNPAESCVTQIYLEAVYAERQSLGVYHKDTGTWKQVYSAYKKQNGTWVEISEEECKAILSTSLITK